MTLPAKEQQYLEDNIATVAFHLGQPGARLHIERPYERPGLIVDPGEVLKEISRRLDRPAVTIPAEYEGILERLIRGHINSGVGPRDCWEAIETIKKLVAERDEARRGRPAMRRGVKWRRPPSDFP